MREIQYGGKAITRSQLEAIAEAESGEVTFNGQVFHYVEDDTWAALYYRAADDDPSPVRFYEFESTKGHYLTIESWEDDDCRASREAFISETVRPQSIYILQNS